MGLNPLNPSIAGAFSELHETDASARKLSFAAVFITTAGINKRRLASLDRAAAVNQYLLDIRSSPLSSCSKIRQESQKREKETGTA